MLCLSTPTRHWTHSAQNGSNEEWEGLLILGIVVPAILTMPPVATLPRLFLLICSLNLKMKEVIHQSKCEGKKRGGFEGLLSPGSRIRRNVTGVLMLPFTSLPEVTASVAWWMRQHCTGGCLLHQPCVSVRHQWRQPSAWG